MADISAHRKFLHDLANSLMILKGSVRRVQREFEEAEGRDIDRALCASRLSKAMEATAKIEELHASYYELIRKDAA